MQDENVRCHVVCTEHRWKHCSSRLAVELGLTVSERQCVEEEVKGKESCCRRGEMSKFHRNARKCTIHSSYLSLKRLRQR